MDNITVWTYRSARYVGRGIGWEMGMYSRVVGFLKRLPRGIREAWDPDYYDNQDFMKDILWDEEPMMEEERLVLHDLSDGTTVVMPITMRALTAVFGTESRSTKTQPSAKRPIESGSDE